MTRSTRFAVVGIACLSFTLTGCGLDQHPAYSPNLKYGIRQDPVIVKSGTEIGPDRYEPDRPGVFPLMKIEDAVSKPYHPYHATLAKLTDEVLRDPTKLSSADRTELESSLEKMFGTPANPKVDLKEAELDEKALSVLQVEAGKLAEGSKRYRIHCLHCHGVSGDGRGPTARWINPHPRDFRSGVYKFQSVDRTGDGAEGLPPSRGDLLRTLRQGIEGTAMPTFNLLKDDELEALASYVIHLSIRGKTEFAVLKNHFKLKDGALVFYNDAGDQKLAELISMYAKIEAEGWVSSQDPASAIKVAKYPYDPNDMKALAASVKRGQQIFTAQISDDFKKAHALKVATAPMLAKKLAEALEKKRAAKKKADPNAKLAEVQLDAEEQAALKLTDAELTEAKKLAVVPQALASAESKLAGAKCVSCHTNFGREGQYRFDTWGTLTKPNNLTLGVFRGGKRPVDIYYRIHSGINGYPMTGFGGPTTFKGNEEYIWDLVNFVSNVPYPAMRQQLGIKLD